MKILNNTHYFNEFTKVYNIVPDTNTFRYQSSRRMGYFQRIYFEHLYTQKVGGDTFFYTLTYNNKSLPIFTIQDPQSGKNVIEHPAFRYKDIRYVTNGRLSKTLERKYGSRLRYFCACETGEGKGTRGLGNNPHYHFIFFTQPLHDKDNNPIIDGYKRISSHEFRKLLEELWLGCNNFVRYKDAKFGIVQPGKFNGVVSGTDAFKYVGKYVIKDASEVQFESDLSRYYFNEVVHRGITSDVFVDYYNYLTKYVGLDISFQEYVHNLEIPAFHAWQRKDPEHNTHSYYQYLLSCRNRFDDAKVFLMDILSWFENHYVGAYVDYRLSEYKREWSGKPRMSKSLGEYGLQFISDIDSNPRITIPSGDKHEIQYPCLFYIRKLYYDTRVCEYTGNILYVLSPLGKKLKKNQLYRSVNNYMFNVQQNVSYALYNKLWKSSGSLEDNSDLDAFVPLDLYHDKKLVKSVSSETYKSDLSVLSNRSDYAFVLRCYAVYKLVYEFRNYPKGFMPVITSECNMSDVMKDYELFIDEDKTLMDFDIGSVYLLVNSHPIT